MIYLTTGGNGAGKTLFTLHDVRKQQIEENRPVYYHGFIAGEQLIEWGWKDFDPKKWQDLPDGSICIFDECQNEFPAKIQGELPDYVNAVAQHRRRRGFDFWMIAPHPSLIHVNIRRLIESPSWHRHLKRTFGADMVSEIKFSYAETTCEKPGSGDKGQVTMRSFPKEVYSWYQSASLHTNKKKLPKQLYVLFGALIAVCIFGFFGYKNFTSSFGLSGEEKPLIAENHNLDLLSSVSRKENRRPLNLVEYLSQGTPRVPGMVHTAPRYDMLTRPAVVPYPKSCIKFGGNPCECRSQNGTTISMSESVCLGIIKSGGVFVDWDKNSKTSIDSGYQYDFYYNNGSREDMLRSSIYDIAYPVDRTSKVRKIDNPVKRYTNPAGPDGFFYASPVVYPLDAQKFGITGRVGVRLTININDGGVKSVEVVSSSGNAMLDNAAIDAAYKSGFKRLPPSGKFHPFVVFYYDFPPK